MGLLAENKRSSKISRDPNNTKWTKNENSFGQKIMRSQGWEPGQYLGAQDAAHAESYTAANASYIRVSLKDDMKGLGFHKAKEDQVTGLDVFSDLLSRLNGKSEEEVEDGRQARMAVKANLYVEQKWGPMRFVRGGLLVGDEMKGDEGSKDSSGSSDDDAKDEPKKSKKRKAAEQVEDEYKDEDEAARKKRRKEERKAKKALASEEGTTPEDDDAKSRKRSKKSKKSNSEDASDDAAPAEETKAERKERKREKKEKKRKRREAAESEGDATTSATASALPSGVSTPIGTGASTPVPGSRNFVRSRFIAQKKEALLDAKALNQIFMVKA